MSSEYPSPMSAILAAEIEALKSRWLLLLVLGLLSIFVGMLAISSAFVATMAAVTVFGVLLIIAGVTELIHAIMVRNLRSFALHLLAATLYSIAGIFMLEHPVRAAGALTLLLAASFLVAGVMRIVFSVLGRFHAWGWVLLNGIIDLFLGIFILSNLDESRLWLIGLFIGIDLIFHGWSWVILAITVRSIRTPSTGGIATV